MITVWVGIVILWTWLLVAAFRDRHHDEYGPWCETPVDDERTEGPK